MRQVLFAITTVLALTATSAAETAKSYVLYCTEEDNAGLGMKGGRYRPAAFELSRFTIKIQGKTLTMARPSGRDQPFQCTEGILRSAVEQRVIECYDSFKTFAFSRKTGRFTMSSIFGYVNGDGDTIQVSYGTCTAF